MYWNVLKSCCFLPKHSGHEVPPHRVEGWIAAAAIAEAVPWRRDFFRLPQSLVILGEEHRFENCLSLDFTKMPNAVLRVDPWRHRLHRLHRMYGLSCLHCRLHLSCLHQTPWYLQSAFETLGRSFGRSFGCFTVPTSDIRNCYLEAACLPPRW